MTNVIAVSLSCGNSDRRFGYSFSVLSKENIWLFSAECFLRGKETELVVENCELDVSDAEKLFDIFRTEDFKKPKKRLFSPVDGEQYVFCVTFSDGSQFRNYKHHPNLAEFFYSLAEKHGNI